jgi:hypothetical protein
MTKWRPPLHLAISAPFNLVLIVKEKASLKRCTNPGHGSQFVITGSRNASGDPLLFDQHNRANHSGSNASFDSRSNVRISHDAAVVPADHTQSTTKIIHFCGRRYEGLERSLFPESVQRSHSGEKDIVHFRFTAFAWHAWDMSLPENVSHGTQSIGSRGIGTARY